MHSSRHQAEQDDGPRQSCRGAGSPGCSLFETVATVAPVIAPRQTLLLRFFLPREASPARSSEWLELFVVVTGVAYAVLLMVWPTVPVVVHVRWKATVADDRAHRPRATVHPDTGRTDRGHHLAIRTDRCLDRQYQTARPARGSRRHSPPQSGPLSPRARAGPNRAAGVVRRDRRVRRESALAPAGSGTTADHADRSLSGSGHRLASTSIAADPDAGADAASRPLMADVRRR